jgi:hypothetical protein
MADFITRLPLEILQQIASLCSFHDILALDRTCRQFHAACADSFVFQRCFLNQVL